MTEVKPYDRQESETQKAYAAFCVYRDLGKSRSLDAAYDLLKERQNSGKRASGFLCKWSKQHSWVSRAEQYDLDLEQRRRLEREQQESAAYNKKISDYRNLNEALGLAFMDLSLDLTFCLQKIVKPIRAKLTNPDPDKPVTIDEKRILSDFPSSLRALSAACEVGSRMAGDSYHLTVLIEKMNKAIGGASDV